MSLSYAKLYIFSHITPPYLLNFVNRFGFVTKLHSQAFWMHAMRHEIPHNAVFDFNKNNKNPCLCCMLYEHLSIGISQSPV